MRGNSEDPEKPGNRSDSPPALVPGYRWARLLPLVGAVGFVALLHTPHVRPSLGDWLVAVVAAGLALAGGRYPLPVTLCQSALVVVAHELISDLAGGVTQLLASVALGELALRRFGAPCWWGVAAVATAAACTPVPGYPPAGHLLLVLLYVGMPLLLGSFLRSQRELARQAEERAREAERRRASEAAAARAAERTAMARELHDVVAHHVSSIVLRLGVVRHVVPVTDPRVASALEDVHTIGGQALTDLRRIVAMLRDPAAAAGDGLLSADGLTAALAEVVERARQAGVTVHADIDGDTVDGLGTEQRHAVLRVAQEGVTNVLKHAGPQAAARLELGRDQAGRVSLTVADDGGGSRPAASEPTGAVPLSAPGAGHGLLGMRERVGLLGGELTAGPRGTGWTLRAVLPAGCAETTEEGRPEAAPSGERRPEAASPETAGETAGRASVEPSAEPSAGASPGAS